MKTLESMATVARCAYMIEVVTLELVFPANNVDGETFGGALSVVVVVVVVVVITGGVGGVVAESDTFGQITPATFSLSQL